MCILSCTAQAGRTPTLSRTALEQDAKLAVRKIQLKYANCH